MWVLTKLSGHMCKKFEVKIKGGCQSKKTAEMLSYSKMLLDSLDYFDLKNKIYQDTRYTGTFMGYIQQ